MGHAVKPGISNADDLVLAFKLGGLGGMDHVFETEHITGNVVVQLVRVNLVDGLDLVEGGNVGEIAALNGQTSLVGFNLQGLGIQVCGGCKGLHKFRSGRGIVMEFNVNVDQMVGANYVGG